MIEYHTDLRISRAEAVKFGDLVRGLARGIARGVYSFKCAQNAKRVRMFDVLLAAQLVIPESQWFLTTTMGDADPLLRLHAQKVRKIPGKPRVTITSRLDLFLPTGELKKEAESISTEFIWTKNALVAMIVFIETYIAAILDGVIASRRFRRKRKFIKLRDVLYFTEQKHRFRVIAALASNDLLASDLIGDFQFRWHIGGKRDKIIPNQYFFQEFPKAVKYPVNDKRIPDFLHFLFVHFLDMGAKALALGAFSRERDEPNVRQVECLMMYWWYRVRINLPEIPKGRLNFPKCLTNTMRQKKRVPWMVDVRRDKFTKDSLKQKDCVIVAQDPVRKKLKILGQKYAPGFEPDVKASMLVQLWAESMLLTIMQMALRAKKNPGFNGLVGGFVMLEERMFGS